MKELLILTLNTLSVTIVIHILVYIHLINRKSILLFYNRKLRAGKKLTLSEYRERNAILYQLTKYRLVLRAFLYAETFIGILFLTVFWIMLPKSNWAIGGYVITVTYHFVFVIGYRRIIKQLNKEFNQYARL